MIPFNPSYLLNALVFALLGVAVFALSFYLLDKMTPYSIWKEIVEEQNVALAILVGLMALGIAVIIAAAVH
ncbi:MAG: DUF350 domain-containing protein [Bryobacteraceae bacterium]